MSLPPASLPRLFAEGRFAEAETLLRRQLAAAPGDEAARYNLALALARQGRLDEARELLAALLLAGSAVPGLAATAVRVLLALGRGAEALPLAEQEARRRPDDPAALEDLGLALRLTGRLVQAAAALRRAVALAPAAAGPRGNLAYLLDEIGETAEALALLEALEREQPARGGPRPLALASLYLRAENAAAAARTYRGLLRHDPASSEAWVGLLRAARLQLDWAAEDEAFARVREALARERGRPQIPTQLALYFPFTPAKIGGIARDYARRLERALPQATLPAGRSPGARLRVAYVSPDLRDHAVWHLAGETLQHHDREQVETAAFALNGDDGTPAYREARQTFEHFFDLARDGDLRSAEAIAAWSPDVIVDLAGYSRGARPNAVRLSPATCRINWLGMPGTMGAGWMQALIGDPTVLPEALRAEVSERVCTLGEGRPYQANRAWRPLTKPERAACGLPEHRPVLAAFHHPRKLDRASVQLWLRILRRVPAAVLWLQSCPPAAAAALRATAEAAGVEPARLIFAPGQSWQDHVQRLAQADLFLDALVYGAHTSASDALRAGVPLLTVLDDTFQSRVGASLARSLGLDDLVVADAAAMEEFAVALLTDPQWLRQLRAGLAARLPESRLFDPAGFARALEDLYARLAGRS